MPTENEKDELRARTRYAAATTRAAVYRTNESDRLIAFSNVCAESAEVAYQESKRIEESDEQALLQREANLRKQIAQAAYADGQRRAVTPSLALLRGEARAQSYAVQRNAEARAEREAEEEQSALVLSIDDLLPKPVA